MNSSPILISIQNLSKSFQAKRGIFFRPSGTVQAVSRVSLDIYQGETLGLVGESGCGKSTLGRCILKLIEPNQGQIFFRNQEITHLSSSHMRSLRRSMQIVFQDPYASLNPKMSIQETLSEPLEVHQLFRSKQEKIKKIHHLLELCGLRREVLNRYPHEFSGGQRQRVCIARALAVEPEFLVCDEPVSALDVSIQAQMINLMQDLQQALGLTYLFISHDLKLVEHIADRVAVMYLGQIVEMATAHDLYQKPKHPYTQALLSAIPIADPSQRKKRIFLQGEAPSPLSPPSGCYFHPRCHLAQENCKIHVPQLRVVSPGQSGKNAHRVACHYAEESSRLFEAQKQ